MTNLWLRLLFDEFFNQGDLEQESGLKVSFLCDRTNTSIYRTQPGFLKFCAIPLVEVLTMSMPHLEPLKQIMEQRVVLFENVDENDDDKKVYVRRDKGGLLEGSALILK